MVSGCPALALWNKVPELDVASWSPAIVGQIASPMINLPTIHGFEPLASNERLPERLPTGHPSPDLLPHRGAPPAEDLEELP